ncbi:hypothetical protein ElyMa_006470800 [Elysia marginata]|uniref:G-protein coupled receptors family 1 profile domain-containing protein n=1 Tax=Elysia marginata TaxID=1093978 RepID=A0AAV4I0M4_9GAST|nr:hypothetical protein ElyMa_006470800 [Elysia marginata]
MLVSFVIQGGPDKPELCPPTQAQCHSQGDCIPDLMLCNEMKNCPDDSGGTAPAPDSTRAACMMDGPTVLSMTMRPSVRHGIPSKWLVWTCAIVHTANRWRWLMSQLDVPVPGQASIAAIVFLLPLIAALNPFLYNLSAIVVDTNSRKRAKSPATA